jgi:DNA (cytosine-5)-methyltransferase 1
MDSDEDILLLQGIKHMDKKVKEVMGKNNVERETKVKNNAKNSEKAKKKKDKDKKNMEQTKKHIETRKNHGKDKRPQEAVLKKPAASVAGGFVEKVAKRARRAPSPELLESTDKAISIGSDCSGYGSDFIALTLLKVNARLVFVAEKDSDKRELLRASHPDVDFKQVIMYHDVTTRDNKKAPYVDMFFSGAPCQPWSQAGEQMGLEDLQKRGVVIFHSLEYVICKRPKIVVLENVKGLTQKKNSAILNGIINILKDVGYGVEWKILDTKENGIPHSRPRLYIVGIRSRCMCRSISFPRSIARAEFEQFIDVDDYSSEPMPESECFKVAIEKARKKWGDQVLNNSWLVVDTASSEQYSNSMMRCIPCITKSRGRHVLN